MTPVEHVPALYSAFRLRQVDRDKRMSAIDAVVKGDWSVAGPEDEALDNRSPNLIQVALEDTAEAASLIPTVRVVPSNGNAGSKKKADSMERLAMSYLDISKIEMLEMHSLLNLSAFGFFVWVVNWDEESKSPRIEWRDPRTCYPESGFRTLDSIRTCLFAREVFVHQLPREYQDKIRAYRYANDIARYSSTALFLDDRVTLLEVYEPEQQSIYALYTTGVSSPSAKTVWHPIPLESGIKNAGGVNPVVIGQRPTLDGEPRGQFDQVVKVLQAHIRLMAMVLDYSDQAVYADIWVKDLIGELPYGGGAVIQLGPQGSIGRVQPAVSSLAVQNELDSLITNIHVGGRWPKTRPGEVDQAIASAKFVEATAGMMNTVIRTMHLVMKRALESALRIAFLQDAELGEKRTVSGILRNQQFLVEHEKSDIDLEARVRVDYGIGLGRDPAQTMVLGIQGMQTGMFSKEYVQENFEGLTDVARERQRIDVEQLKDMAMAQLLQGMQDGTVPKSALVEIARARANGEDLFELFDKFIVKPAEAQQQAMIPSGLGGLPQAPGAAPGGPGGPGLAPPQAPPAEQLLGGLGGQPQQPETIGRLSVPLPGGGFAGSQSKG